MFVQNNKIQRRIIARLLLLLLMKANEHHSLEARRKQHMAIYQVSYAQSTNVWSVMPRQIRV